MEFINECGCKFEHEILENAIEAYGSEVAFGEWSAYKQAEEIVKKGGIE